MRLLDHAREDQAAEIAHTLGTGLVGLDGNGQHQATAA
jgi:hypothetical protein